MEKIILLYILWGIFYLIKERKIWDNKYTEDGIMVKIQLEKDLLKEIPISKTLAYIPTWVRKI